MKVIETKVYEIGEHPNKEKCFEWIRSNWSDLNDFSSDDLRKSIQALSLEIGGVLDYSLSNSPWNGDFIKFKDYDVEKLNALDAVECPITGSFWDALLIEGLKKGSFQELFKTRHEDIIYTYYDAGLIELCEANEFHFDLTGKFHSI